MLKIIKLVTLLLLIAGGSLTNALAQRISYTINSDWKFIYADDATYAKPDAKTDNWQAINIPHSWNAQNAFDDADGYERGIGWYRHNLFIPKSEKGRHMYLFFEGANQVATVFVNGNQVGNHIGGYTAFRVDITKYAQPGQNNSIAVKVDNSHNLDIPPLSADFTFYGGIYRDVFFQSVPIVHFDMDNYGSNGVFISTPKVNANTAQVNIKGKYQNEDSKTAKIIVKTTVYDPEHKTVTTQSTKVKLKPADNAQFTFNLSIANPKLWSPQTPNLYHVETELIDAKSGAVLDLVRAPLGFRWFELQQDGLVLNGKKIKLMGVNRHQDFAGLGNALPNTYHYRDMKMLKDMGANFIRIAHYPQDPAILEACDRLGLLAWEEVPVVNEVTGSQAFTENSVNMQKEMIRQHYNHPSVIMWGYMNEVMLAQRKRENFDAGAKEVYDLSRVLENLTKAEDPYRLTTIAHHQWIPEYEAPKLNNLCDLTGYNLYPGWYGKNLNGLDKFVDEFTTKFAGQPLFVSEFGAGADPRLHSYQPLRFDFSQEYQNIYHEYYLKFILNSDKVSGGTVWNFADFGSEGRKDAVPHINNKGLVAFDRKPKDTYYLYQAALWPKLMVHINTNFWTQRTEQADAGKNVATRPISVYSNATEVTLTANGHLIGTQKITDYKATFDVPLQAGINKIEATAKRGKELSKDFSTIDVNLLPADMRTKAFDNLYINVGSNCQFVDENAGVTYIQDKMYTPGSYGIKKGVMFKKSAKSSKYGVESEIFTTDLDPIYQTAADSLTHYQIDAPNGIYNVTLMFAELLSNQEKEKLLYNLGSDEGSSKKNTERIFSVTANGQTIATNLNLPIEPGSHRPLNRTIELKVSNGQGILLQFEAMAGTALLNGLQIVRKH